jgi:ATP-dependent RNA helicase HelY
LVGITPRYRHFHRKRHLKLEDSAPSFLKKAEKPFALRIHRNLRPVLDRIGVPEPQAFIPDPFQVEALDKLAGADVLVTAPTGAGKTYIATEAIRHVFINGGKSWYASPLKALSNAKHEEFSQLFGSDNVGILTGDRKENVQAPIIVGTTEILRNQLYDTMHRGEDLEVDLVVLDEAHYLGDSDRGVVWEEVLIYLPARVRLLLLSATIQNSQEICDWLSWLRHAPCERVATYERPVPLFPLFLFPSGELSPLSTKRGLFSKIQTVDRRSFSRNDFPDIRRLMDVLRKANLLPAIFFLKSRADCEKAISFCGPASRAGGGNEGNAFGARLDGLLEIFPFLRKHQHLSILRSSRVGAHHGGQLPHWKLLLETLMQEGHLDAIFSTSTVAAGVNFPARTVVTFQSDRFNGKEFADLTATDIQQMTGRAGRRGRDEIGFVLIIPGAHQDAELVHSLLRSPPDPIMSQIRVNFSMVLNLLLSHSPDEIRGLFDASLATFQNLKNETQVVQEFETAGSELEEWLPEMACRSIDQLARARPRYGILKEQLRKSRKVWRRQATASSFHGLLEPGRTFVSQRGTPYVAVSHARMEEEEVEAVRIATPVRYRRGRVRTYRVGFHRIRDLGQKLDSLPPLNDRGEWRDMISRLASEPFLASSWKSDSKGPLPMEATAHELSDLISEKASLPCDICELYGPCLKSSSHPFSLAVQRYFDLRAQMNTIQEQLWRSFMQHYELLGEEGYVDERGHLTEDGLWATKLRLDQPLLISEGIRKGVFPSDDPELLAALIAPFVMDRDRAGDVQLSNLVWKYPDLAKPFFKMLQDLQRLRERLKAAGFNTPLLPFWPVATVYHWAHGAEWETLREISGMDEGDLAMVVLRTADHLRQIEALSETHPSIAASARRAIDLILREPVLVE